MLPNIKQLVLSAVRNRRRILIQYGGQTQSRVLEPHLYYRAGNDSLLLIGYQVKGYSSGGRKPPFWRPFQLAKIDNLFVMDELFEPRMAQGYAPMRAMIKGEIQAEVKTDSRYAYFNKGVCGPPFPSHLTTSLNLGVRLREAG